MWLSLATFCKLLMALCDASVAVKLAHSATAGIMAEARKRLNNVLTGGKMKGCLSKSHNAELKMTKAQLFCFKL